MLELAPSVYLADIRYSGNPAWDMLGDTIEEFRAGGALPATAWHLGSYVKFNKDGSVRFSLSASRQNELTPVAFVQDERHGERISTPSRDKTPEDEMALFTKAVKTSLTEDHELRAGRNPYNMIRLILPSQDGSWTIEEFAIVAQNNRLFLTHQRLYAGQAIRAHEEAPIFAPGFSQWGEVFSAMLEDAFRSCPLPTASEKATEPEMPNPTAGNGIVKYFNLAQGWGSVYIAEGSAVTEARLYFGHAKSQRGRIVYFEPGEEVAYKEVVPARATSPDRGTLFTREIRSVCSLAPKPTPAETYAGC